MMEIQAGPFCRYSLVFKLFPVMTMALGEDGYFHESGYKSGILVKSDGAGTTWYHRPELYIDWKQWMGEP